jgi:hypothetical protein
MVRRRSTKRSPWSVWVPWLVLRHITACAFGGVVRNRDSVAEGEFAVFQRQKRPAVHCAGRFRP